MTTRRLLLLPTLLSLAGLALACASNEDISTAPVSLALDDVRDRHAPPDVLVVEKTVTRTASAGACGHSPLCVIILPVLLYDAFFPEKYLEVSVEEGERTLTASYTTGGDLLQARLRDGSRFRDYRVLRLDELGKSVTVEVSSAPVETPDKTTRSSILDQVDLLSDYRAVVADTDRGKKKVALVVEAWTWLDEEAWPLVAERLGDVEELDEVRAGVLSAVCEGEARQRARMQVATAAASPSQDALLLVSMAPGMETSVAALQCGSKAPVFLEALVDGLCEDDSVSLGLMEQLERVSGAEELGLVVADRIAACPDPVGRALLTQQLGLPLDRETVAAALAQDGRRADLFVRQVDVAWPEVRATLAQAWTGPHRRELLRAAWGVQLVPTDAEASALMAIAVAPGGKLDLNRHGDHATALGLLALRAPGDRAKWLQTLDAPEGFEGSALRVVLGDAQHELPVARELAPSVMPVTDPTGVTTKSRLAAFVLPPQGCDSFNALHDARKAADAAGEGTLGQVCNP